MRTYVGRDEIEELADIVLDSMWRCVDRQKARYEIEALEVDLAKLRKTLAQYEIDKTDVDHKFALREVELNEKIAVLRAEADEIKTNAYDALVKSGRRTAAEAFELQGHEKQAFEVKHKAIEAIVAQAVKEANEKAQGVQEFEKSCQRYREEIDRTEGEIDKRRKLLGLME